jgi:hypothetical protein
VNSPKELAERRAYVLQVEHGRVGRAKRFWTGAPGDAYVSPVNKKPVAGAMVLETEEGDAFVVKDENSVVPLTDKEERVYVALSKMVKNAVEIITRGAKAMDMDLEVFAVVAASALLTQVSALGAVAHQARERRARKEEPK